MTRTGWALSLLALLVVGCVAPPAPAMYNHPTKSLAEKQQDAIECSALASQAAQGAGGWSSDRAVRGAIYANARDQYLTMCLESRGWYQGAVPTQAPTPVENAPRQDAGVFRRCAQAALVTLGLWDGPVDGEDSPRWVEIWGRYLDNHMATAHDHRQTTSRAVIDQELAARGQHMNWDRCGS
jgi:hypothetical protein